MKSSLKDDIRPNNKTGISGKVTVWSINETTQQRIKLFTQSNLIMYKWAWIVAKTAGHGDSNFKLSSMYFEFKNVTSPSDSVAVPSYSRQDDISYYTTLANPFDYLRVPLSALPSITIESGYETYFTGDEGNTMNFFAQTSGTVGELSRTFSSGSNSKVFGVALLATPSWSDSSQDLIFARTYFDVPDQQLKLSGSQIGVTWSIPLL